MDNLNNIPTSGNWGDAASKLNDNFNKVKQAVTTVENVSQNNKGYFSSLSALNTAFPSPKPGQTAYVYGEASSTKYYIYNAVNGAWVTSSVEAPAVGVNIAEYTKSGGSSKTTKQVEDDIVQLAGEVNIFGTNVGGNTIRYTRLTRGTVQLNGSIMTGGASDLYYLTDFIPVKTGQSVSFKSYKSSPNGYVISGYTIDDPSSIMINNCPATIVGTSVTNQTFSIKVPEGISFIRINTQSETDYIDITISDKFNFLESDTLFKLSKHAWTGGLISPTGEFTESVSYMVSDFISVKEGQVVRFRSTGSVNSLVISAYSSNSQASFIVGSSANIVGGAADHSYAAYIPKGVNYIRVCSAKQGISPFYYNTGYFGVMISEGINNKAFIEIKEKLQASSEIIISSQNTVGEMISIDGTIVTPSYSYRTTGFIPVQEGQIISAMIAAGNVLAISAYTSDSQASIELSESRAGIGGGTIAVEHSYIVGAGINYIRVCFGTVNTPLPFMIYILDPNLTNLYKGVQQSQSEIVGINNQIVDIRKENFLKYPNTQPRKAMFSFVMDCGYNFFESINENYQLKLREYGVYKSTYAVMPDMLTDSVKVNFLRYFYNLGNEFAIHSDSRRDGVTGSEFKTLIQTYYSEMASKGFSTNGWIALNGAESVSNYDTIKEFVGWGQLGPKNYKVTDIDAFDAINNLSTDPKNLRRLNIEQLTAEQNPSGDETMITAAKNVIDQAISVGGYVCFYTHSYEVYTAAYTTREYVLTEILKHLKAKADSGLCYVGGMSEMVEFYYAKRYNEA